jgi:hypothetical protein
VWLAASDTVRCVLSVPSMETTAPSHLRHTTAAAAGEAPGGSMIHRLRLTLEEHDYVKHAASLKSLSMSEYIKRAINAQLRREGVDAVLIRQSDDQ